MLQFNINRLWRVYFFFIILQDKPEKQHKSWVRSEHAVLKDGWRGQDFLSPFQCPENLKFRILLVYLLLSFQSIFDNVDDFFSQVKMLRQDFSSKYEIKSMKKKNYTKFFLYCMQHVDCLISQHPHCHNKSAQLFFHFIFNTFLRG